ncbi:MAG: LysM peptidoglycan-binding domain-containing protein [Muribaculaceae bacterium]|nr:LysM peptidoglycan-binding domain-containing protein [Muribaculaceae bacterium]
MRKLRYSIAAFLCALAMTAQASVDLPVKSINGHKYFFYEVRTGDTVFSLSRTLGISRADIIRCNPAAADGLRAGATLYFPYDEFADSTASAISHEVKRGETLFGLAHRYGVTPDDIIALNPHTTNGLKAGETILIPASGAAADTAHHASEPNETPAHDVPVPPVQESEAEPARQAVPESSPVATPPLPAPEPIIADTDSMADDIPAAMRDAVIAVVLPFDLGEGAPSRQAQLYMDFYRGMLLAADSLSATGPKVTISVFDAADCDTSNEDISNASILIAPEDAGLMTRLAAAAGENGGVVLNIFNLKDESYMSNETLLQGNIPQSLMYAKAYLGMRERFGNTRPVLLKNAGGRNEKEAFVDFIREKYIADGIAPVEITYNGTLRSTDLDILDPAERYVVVPSSGALGEFNKISHALRAFRDDSATASIEIFGYPDWTAFRNDALDMLHTLGATIYSRIYMDPQGDASNSLSSRFTDTFGNAPMEVVPNQGALGYDVASMLIEKLRAGEGEFEPDGTLWKGLQSAFRFVKASDNGGYVNDALYIITYQPGNRSRVTIL